MFFGFNRKYFKQRVNAFRSARQDCCIVTSNVVTLLRYATRFHVTSVFIHIAFSFGLKHLIKCFSLANLAETLSECILKNGNIVNFGFV